MLVCHVNQSVYSFKTQIIVPYLDCNMLSINCIFRVLLYVSRLHGHLVVTRKLPLHPRYEG